jgi:hypothetical protein
MELVLTFPGFAFSHFEMIDSEDISLFTAENSRWSDFVADGHSLEETSLYG